MEEGVKLSAKFGGMICNVMQWMAQFQVSRPNVTQVGYGPTRAQLSIFVLHYNGQ
jgi:hypothetical protein